MYTERKYQKNRIFRKPKKIKIIFGDSALVISKEGRLELIHLTIIKYFIKRCLKSKPKSLQVSEKIWYFGKFNFFLQKKSKNSRMGKGKGMLDRSVMRFKKNFKIFEFKGLSKYRLFKFLKNINKKFFFKFFLIFKFNKNYNLWCDNSIYIHYYNKYLLY